MFRRQGIFSWFLLIVISASCLLVPRHASAVTRYASATGSSGNAPCINSSSRCNLQTALNNAVAGDIVLVGNGTYAGPFNATANAGTSSSKILVQAENRHQAILQGNSTGAAYAIPGTNYGFLVGKAYWIIDGFDFKQHQYPITTDSNGTNLEVRNCLVHDFMHRGLYIRASNSYIHDNVIGPTYLSTVGDSWQGIMLDRTDGHRIQRNIIYSITNGAYIEYPNNGFPTNGYAIRMQLAHNSLIQGNIFIDGAKGTGVRCLTDSIVATPGGPWCSGNTIQDNIFAHGQGAGIQLAENNRDSLVINNLFYNVFFDGPGGKGNDPGGNVYRHNTIYLGTYSWMGARLEVDNNSVGDLNATWRDNLIYSAHKVPSQKLLYNTGGSIKTASHNLFWSPVSPSSNWFVGYSPVGTDVLQQPVFTNAATGDLSLAGNSPGKNAASDGTDIGIAYNSFLTKIWANYVVNMPTQEWTNPGSETSHTFIVTAGHWYQVLVYAPDTNPYLSVQTYTSNGNSLKFDLGVAINGGCCRPPWVLEPPVRYMYAGTWPATNNNFTVTWQHANAAGKILIRQMPKPTEAYSLISGQSAEVNLLEPKNLRITNQP